MEMLACQRNINMLQLSHSLIFMSFLLCCYFPLHRPVQFSSLLENIWISKVFFEFILTSKTFEEKKMLNDFNKSNKGSRCFCMMLSEKKFKNYTFFQSFCLRDETTRRLVGLNYGFNASTSYSESCWYCWW